MALERVSTEATLKGKVRKDFAWDIITDFGRYSTIMKNIDKVEVLEKNDREGTSKWFVTIEDAPLTWVEKDFFDRPNYEVRFQAIDGDFEQFQGTWRVKDCDGEGIRIHFDVDYDLGIPVIEEVLGAILRDKMQSNIDSMLKAIKDELTKSYTEERKYPRFDIKQHNYIGINGQPLRTYIVNLSRQGMLFFYEGTFDSQHILMQIDSQQIPAEVLYNDLKHKNVRVMFNEPLAQEQLDAAIEFLRFRNVRLHQRFLVNQETEIEVGGQSRSVYLVNLSCQGMLIRSHVGLPTMGPTFKLLAYEVRARDVHYDVKNATYRIIFDQPLADNIFAAITQAFGINRPE